MALPLVVIGAALAGVLVEAATAREPVAGDVQLQPLATLPTRASIGRTLGVVAAGAGIWLLPLAALSMALGPHILVRLGAFSSRAALLSVGGPFTVLAYAAQSVVGAGHWLAPGELLEGMGLAQRAPGPPRR